jgi:filamin
LGAKARVNDLSVDFSDGVQFCELLERISGKSLPNWDSNPKTKEQKLENAEIGFRFMKEEGVVLVGIEAENLVDSRLENIL